MCLSLTKRPHVVTRLPTFVGEYEETYQNLSGKGGHPESLE